MKISNTQRDLYMLCPKKYQFRYVHKLRPKHKGSALFFGSAFDKATEVLLMQRDLVEAKKAFQDAWMSNESNYYCKFGKNDLDLRILTPDDLAKLHAATTSLNNSKALQDYHIHKDVEKLIKDIKKLKEMSFTRDLTDNEDKYLHFANILSMARKGELMLEAFYKNILPHITKVVGTQVAINIPDGTGNSIQGYIDLLCEMDGYKLPNGRVLNGDLVLADVKSASPTYWAKLDDLTSSDQLDTYLSSEQVQSIKPTNLVSYFAVAKNVSKEETTFCKSCGHVRASLHKKCPAVINGDRCNGDWNVQEKYFCEAKIVIGERDLGEAQQVLNDYDDIAHAIQQGVFPRNRNSCEAFGGLCEYRDVCGLCLTSDQLSAKLEDWKKQHGE